MLAAFPYGSSMVLGSLIGSYIGTIAPAKRRALLISVPQTFSLVAGTVAPYLGGYLYMLSPYCACAISVIPMPLLVLFALTLLKG